MSVGHIADDDQLDGADGHDADDHHLDAGLLRVIRRRGWTGGGLVTAVLAEWFPTTSIVHPIAHYLVLLLAAVLGLDLAWARLVKLYRKIRGKIIIIDLSPSGPPGRPVRGNPDRPGGGGSSKKQE